MLNNKDKARWWCCVQAHFLWCGASAIGFSPRGAIFDTDIMNSYSYSNFPPIFNIQELSCLKASWSSGMIPALGIALKLAGGPVFESRWSPYIAARRVSFCIFGAEVAMESTLILASFHYRLPPFTFTFNF